MDNGVTEKIHENRIKYLKGHNSATTSDVIKIDEVSDVALSGQFLVCLGGDIDKMGEKFQQDALKYFPDFRLLIYDRGYSMAGSPGCTRDISP